MGREVRMVPADWRHPKGEDGKYIPLYGRSYNDAGNEWMQVMTRAPELGEVRLKEPKRR